MTRDDVESECTRIARELCTDPAHGTWRNAVFSQRSSRWYSVVVEVDRQGCPIDRLMALPREARRAFVYTRVDGPFFRSDGRIVIVFALAGSLWTTVVHCGPPATRTGAGS